MNKIFFSLSLFLLSSPVLFASENSSEISQKNPVESEVLTPKTDSDEFVGKHSRCTKKHSRKSTKGATGATGPAGPAGPAGPQGATGATGTSGVAFSPGFVSVSSPGAGLLAGAPIPIPIPLGVVPTGINAYNGGSNAVVTNSEFGTVNWDPSNIVAVLTAPGYYKLTYGVSPGSTTANAVLSLRSTSLGGTDIPGSKMIVTPTSTMQSISTIYQSPGGEGITVNLNNTSVGAAVLTLASLSDNQVDVFFFEAVRLAD